MANLRPVKRKELISKLKQLGFEGPYSGGKHQFYDKKQASAYYSQPASK